MRAREWGGNETGKEPGAVLQGRQTGRPTAGRMRIAWDFNLYMWQMCVKS